MPNSPRHTAYRGMMVPMMEAAIKGLLYALKQGGIADTTPFAHHVGYAEGVLDQIKIEMESAPDYVPDEEIAALYASGLSAADVGAKVGRSPHAVRDILLRAGVKMRRRGRSPTKRMLTLYPERTADMIEMRKKGATLQEIGAKYNITRERVRQILLREGVDTTIRPVSEADMAIVQEYIAGDSLWVVAERHQIGLSALKHLITRAGYKVRPGPMKHTKHVRKRAKEAAKLYREGLKTTDIAERLGFTKRADGGHGGQIYRLLAMEGVRPDRAARKTPKTERCEPTWPKRADWSKENIERLKWFWNKDFPASYIAKRLGGISRNAVLGQVRRLGLTRGGKQ